MYYKTYSEVLEWRATNDALPECLQIVGPHPAREEWHESGRFQVHLDRWEIPKPKATIVLVHGAGGNGRLLGPFARIFNEAGFDAVAPDLPGYGLTQCESKFSIRYEDWHDVLSDIVEKEAASDLPLVLFGASMGGMLAYDVTARTRLPKALIATCLLEPADERVRRSMVRWPWMAGLIDPFLMSAPALTDSFPILMKFASNMQAITNDTKVTEAIISDPRAGGNWMPAGFLRTFLTAKPEVSPEEFDSCPVLLAHPALDRWTDVSISMQFLSRISKVKASLSMLEDGGHFPIESKAIEQLRMACSDFISEAIG